MSKIKYYLEKYKLYVIISFIILFIISLLLCLFLKKDEVSASEVIIEKEVKVEETKNEEIKTIKVDVKGRVKKEGVYELDINSRVIDQTTPNMIQGLKGIFERNALISRGYSLF